MIDALPLLLGPEGYQISRSVRLRGSASASFSRTPGSAGNRKTWTWSGWVKRGALGSTSSFFGLFFGSNNNSQFYVMFNASNQLEVGLYTLSALVSTAVFRDPSAWYHIAFAFDSTQATAANRLRLYVNGNEITAFATDNRSTFTQNGDFAVNAAQAHYLGYNNVGGFYFDGYLTEINFIDGQALTPASFGETDAVTGVWKPKKYTGTYGTNGFYLNFSDNSAATAAAIGKDYSGNGNNWTPNNISVTAGVTYDSMLDVPTQWPDGGNGRGNYCVWNAAAQSTVFNGTVTRSNGNLTSTDGGTTYGLASFGTIGVATGKWYWETTLTSAGGTFGTIGVIDLNSPLAAPNIHTGILYAQGGNKSSGSGVFTGSGSTAYGATYTTGDIIGIALDLDAGTITFYKNGASQGVAYTGISGNYTPAIGDGQNSTSYTFDLNCGQRPFSYTPPTGFLALNTLNLPTPTILKGNQYFNAVLWTGDGSGSSRTISNVGFQPDFVWTKSRTETWQHLLYDAVRGAGNESELASSSTAAEGGVNANLYGYLSAFSSDGMTFTSGTDGTADQRGYYNKSGQTYVAWNWKEGATQGFDIVTYTGNSTNRTIAHNLGVAPRMMIVKNRSAVYDWPVYHANIAATNYLYLNTTSASAAAASLWNNTAPTSSVFSVGTSGAVNNSAETYVAYLFAAVTGYSSAFSYTGNGSTDGPFIFLGFRPRWIMWKKTNSSTNAPWVIVDTARSPYNLAREYLLPNASDAETSVDLIDILSNGFKWRGTAPGGNNSGDTYIGFAMAESPFKFSLGR